MGFEDYKTIIVMIGCQFIYAVTTLSVRAAVLEEMSSRVIVVYRQCIAFLLIAPFAYFSSVTANQNAYFEGLALVSSSVASAMYNLAPAITFIMAYTMGLEKVHLRSLRSIAKIIGTIVCVIGAVALALLKGPKLLNMEFRTRNSLSRRLGVDDQTWLIGCLFVFVSSCCWSLSLILQVPITACYKDHVSLTAWMSLLAALQSGMLTLIIEPNMKAWKLTSPLQLFCCFFAGMASAVTFFAQAWCITRRGPLFPAMFQPLCTVIVTVFSCIFMHEELYTGSLIGGVAATIGLYIVLWGKAKDSEEVKEETTSYQVSDSCRIDLEEPLLHEKPAYLGDHMRTNVL